MLNLVLHILVFGFVALAALGHVLVFTAIVFGRSERSEGAVSRSISRFQKISTAA
jgi:hypothetical protein